MDAECDGCNAPADGSTGLIRFEEWLLSRQAAYESDSPRDPLLKFTIALNPLRGNHNPTSHGLSGYVELLDEGRAQGSGVHVETNSRNEILFPNSDTDIAVQKVSDAAKHLLFS